MGFRQQLKKENFVVLLAGACYVVSLTLPALLFTDHAPVTGAKLLFYGWWGILYLNFAWLANLAFFAGIRYFLKMKYGLAGVSGGIAFSLGYMSVLAKKWWFNEAHGTEIAALGPAYNVWMASFFVLMAAAFLIHIFGRSNQIPRAPNR